MGMRHVALAVCVALILGACDGNSAEPDSTSRTNTPASGATIEILSPQDGANVSPLFDIRVSVSGVELGLGPNESLIPGKAHWHATIDGEGLPYAYDNPGTTVGPIAPGEHTLGVALFVNDADAIEVASDAVEVTIPEAAEATRR